MITGLPARRHRGRGRRGRAGGRRGGRNLPDTRRKRLRDLQLRPCCQASVLARGIVGTRGDIPVRGVADAQAGLRPAHRTVPRRRGGPGADVRRAGRRTASCSSESSTSTPGVTVTDLPLSGFRIGVTAARKVDEQVTLLERRGAAVEWAPALSVDPNHVDDAAAGRHRGGAGRTGRPVPGDHRHRHEGVVRGGRGVGAAADRCSRRWVPPRSWPAARRASAPCAGAGCASCGRRSRSASRTCSRTCAAATSPACGSSCRSTASRSRWSRTRCAGRAPT